MKVKKNQLNSYIKAINKKEFPKQDINGKIINEEAIKNIISNNKIIPVYFKTGTMTVKEKEESENLVDFDVVYNLLIEYKINNEIISQWKERILRLKEFKKTISDYISNNKTIEELHKLFIEFNYDGLEIMNQLGDFIFEGKCYVGTKYKFYNNNDTYNYITWRSNAIGHPEINLGIKRNFLYKKTSEAEYSKNKAEYQLVFETEIRMRNFELCIVFETFVLDKNEHIFICNGKFGKDGLYTTNPQINNIFQEERERFYEKIKNISEKLNSNSKFKEINIKNINSRNKQNNILLTKIDWDEVLNLSISDFKEYVLEFQKELEKEAIKFGFEKQW